MHGAYTRTLKLRFRRLRRGSKNHAENELENTPKNDRIWHPFRSHLGFLFVSEKPSKINQKINPFWKRFWHRFLHHFGIQNPFKNASQNNTIFKLLRGLLPVHLRCGLYIVLWCLSFVIAALGRVRLQVQRTPI